MFIAGLMGMPRRVSAYDVSFTSYNQLATLGALILAVSTLPFLYNAVLSWARGSQGGRQSVAGPDAGVADLLAAAARELP